MRQAQLKETVHLSAYCPSVCALCWSRGECSTGQVLGTGFQEMLTDLTSWKGPVFVSFPVAVVKKKYTLTR